MAPSRADEDESCCGLAFLKYVMFFLTFLTMICGILFLGVAGKAYFINSEIIYLSHHELLLYSIYLMAGLGVLIIFNSFLCCGSTNSKCVISVYVLILFIILALEIVLCYVILMISAQMEMSISRTFVDDVTNRYGIDTEITKAVNAVQIDGHCCGAQGFDDYVKESASEESEENKSKKQYVPDSCCRSPKQGCGINDHPSNIHYSGCENYLQEYVRDNMYYMSTVAVASVIIQMFTLLFSCCVCFKTPRRTHEPLNKRNDHEMSLFD